MSDINNWFQRIPTWVFWSFLPTFGGLAIAYAGYKAKTPAWLIIGLFFTGGGLILSSGGGSQIGIFVWLAQIGTAFYLKKPYLVKTSPKGMPIGDVETARILAGSRGQVDINNCSKDDIVYKLGLPIVYANEIESLRQEGHFFTRLEELSVIIGIPQSDLKRIEPLISFTPKQSSETDIAWNPLNLLSVAELIACGLSVSVAEKIVQEREIRGIYKSLMDVRRRTGLPLSCYQDLF